MASKSVVYPAPTPMTELPAWAETLQQIAAEPLVFCEDFPAIAQCFEVWWAHDAIHRPLFIAAANTNPSHPITRRLELIQQPDAWVEAKFADMGQLYRVGDALPWMRADFGPVLMGGLFARLCRHYGRQLSTGLT